MSGRRSSRFVLGLAVLILGGAGALAVVAVPALAGTSSSTPTSTAPGVTTAAPRTPATTGVTTAPTGVTTAPSQTAAAPALGLIRRLSAPGLRQRRDRTSLGLRQAGARLAAACRGAQSEHGHERAGGRKSGEPGRQSDLDLGWRQYLPRRRRAVRDAAVEPGHDAHVQRRWRARLLGQQAVGVQPDPRFRSGLRRGRRCADGADGRAAAPEQQPIPTRSRRPSATPARWRRPATTPRRAISRKPLPRSSPPRRTARWLASPTRPRTKAGFLIKLMASQGGDYGDSGEGRRRQPRLRAQTPAATSAARPTTAASPSCIPSTSTSSSITRSPPRR